MQGFTGYPVTGYYPAGYGYLPDIRIIRIRFFFAGLSGRIIRIRQCRIIRQLPIQGGKKIKEQHILGGGTFFCTRSVQNYIAQEARENFSRPSGVFRPPPRAKMFLIQLKSVPNERNICKSFTVILRKYQNFTIILNCNRNNFI